MSGARHDLSRTASVRAEADPEASRVVVHRVEVLASPDRAAVGRAALLAREPVRLGRASQTAGPLGLKDPELSGNHAALLPTGGGWELVDQKSRNGTFLDGGRVASAPLRSGSILRAGGSVLLYERLELRAGVELGPEQGPLLGRSVATRLLRAEIERVAPRAVTVLVLGETGVGKELVAQAIHSASGRQGALVPVNCGALPRDLVEAELFGNVAGAFTGAARDRPGLFAAAEGGTILLDEIGEMPPAVQPALLRALATGEIRPVGAATPRQVDVRVVAATHRDLAAAVAEGTFRADLLARLSGWVLRVEPLRERRADIPHLARHFLAQAGASPELSADAAEALCLHDWPANVRELGQVMGAAAVRMATATELRLAHLPEALAAPVSRRRAPGPGGDDALPLALLVQPDAVPTADELRLVLRHLDGNVARVAAFFGKDRRQVYRWLARHGLDEPR